MNFEREYYSNALKEALTLKQRVNRSYSLRAFSKYLGMHPSTLTLVMQGKRPLPKKNVETVISRLALTPSSAAIFRESLDRKKSEGVNEYFNRYVIDDSNYKIIAEWEHYAVITLIETDSFVSDFSFISKRLNISIKRVEVVIRNLELAKLIAKDGPGNYILLKGPLRTSEDISSRALKESHLETLEMGKTKLSEVEVMLRDFSSITVAANPKKLQEAKEIIREFRKKMATLLKDGEKTEVYQLAIQLYPLTNISEGDIK